MSLSEFLSFEWSRMVEDKDFEFKDRPFVTRSKNFEKRLLA